MGAGLRPSPLEKRRMPADRCSWGLLATKFVEMAYVKNTSGETVALARGKRQPHHIVGRKVGGDGAAQPNCQIGMRFRADQLEHASPGKYPSQFVAESRHVFPPAMVNTFSTPGIKTF